VACVIGDGEAEAGPLATAWHSNKFLDPVTDGAVLPILHLNGDKIASPTLLARITREELEQLLRGYGWTPYFVEGDDPPLMHEQMAATPDRAVEQIRSIQQNARSDGDRDRPRWPMIVLNSPQGWTGPKVVDGRQVEGSFRSYQVPLSNPAAHPEHLTLLEDWLRSYRPDELFDEQWASNGQGSGPDVVMACCDDVPTLETLAYRRTNHNNIHVRGYKEEGTITTAFDMTVLTDLDRFHLVMDTIDRLPQTGDRGLYLKQQLKDKLVEHQRYITTYGEDLPEVRNWQWSS
jgi:phosphoketolase